ncbi:carboxyvinyl-carboxyphosphonate phosphorylmutase [Reichenbachiella sp. 5M10]|uniref:isocitrate lyase/PEP mutase family protein n=1 Tax=Reichenbachiella sp. 5M10 TaxID=1889772 RepID=UPI000C1519F3|nr:isocitrate lyase/phosphoenolpyruvate mutase family protein [Reichenbachiella sp. 5M10]PIB37369.1 carboxyvinyl-carboxyphosphonate phosphorylmutase [Reichenbachiella sp. 5M10]
MTFKDLHNQSSPLLIGNVWDVPSTKTANTLNFQAIGTSSAAIAALLGYQDGEEMAFSELEYFIKKITQNTSLPVSVDIEAGYSRKPKVIVNHIKRLVQLGVVGINMEDSVIKKTRTLVPADDFAEMLNEVNALLEQAEIDIFINVRTDTFILLQDNILEETKKRMELYERVGANGIFIPCLEKESDIKEIVAATDLPINVMSMPNLPDFDTLGRLGVKRISTGNFLFDKMYQYFEKTTKDILNEASFSPLFKC